MFYVYVDYLTETRRPFYVGKGKAARVRASKRGRLHREFTCRHPWYRVVVNSTPDEAEAFRIEAQLIAYLQTRDHQGGANRTDGGEGTSGHRFSDVARANLSAAHKGKTPSAETRAKMSATRQVVMNRPDVKAKIAAALRGIKRSAETRAKLSAVALTRSKQTPEAVERSASKRRGRKHSLEAKAKISAAFKARREASRGIVS